ncbi:unnamed protein product [Pylaiella littoralis]
MLPRKKYFGTMAARLRYAPARAGRMDVSGRTLQLPPRGLFYQSQHQQHQQQHQLLSPSPHPPPPPPPPLSRVTSPKRLMSAVTPVRVSHTGRHCYSSTRQINRVTNRCFSATVKPPSPSSSQGGARRQRGQEKHTSQGDKQRVVVGMSGGVDSSVVAMLLQQQGYEVVGVFMRNWDEQDETGSAVCTADADLEDARRVGIHLGITVETVDFSREYWNQVFEPSLEEFARCRTPNMDVACNRFIKFDAFREYALGRMAADLVATGHYARTSPGPGGDWSRPVLVEAADGNKDQTYFLCGVPTEGLAKVLFPLGGLTKPEVRNLAAKGGLPVAQKRESMGVCFVGKRRSWADFVSQYLTPSPGNFVCADTGEIMGKHSGVQLYTVGQKSQLDGMPEKYYVARLDPATNSVIVARGKDNPSLFARGLSALSSEFNWVAGSPPAEVFVDPGGCVKAEEPTPAPEASARDGEVGEGAALEDGDGGLAAAASGAREGREGGDVPAENHSKESPATAAEAAGVDGGKSSRQSRRNHSGNGECSRGTVEGGDAGRRRKQEHNEVVGLRCQYRCRHRQELLPCTVKIIGEARGGAGSSGCADGRGDRGDYQGSGGGRHCSGSGIAGNLGGREESVSTPPSSPSGSLIYVSFDEPAKAVAPGQVVALYKDGVCLGGGAILRAEGHCSPVLVRTAPSALPPLSSPSRTKTNIPRPRTTDS